MDAGRFSEDIPVTMDEHVQKAVDCYNAGATVLHLHVRELDGKGSKRLSKFNELLGRLREAVPDMILQVGGSISFAPEGEGADAKWLSDDTRHMLAELTPKPDQVTVAINTVQMNITELMNRHGHRRHVVERSRVLGRVPRDDRAGRPRLGRRAPAPPAGGRHPAAFPAHWHARAGNARTDHPPRRVYRGPLNVTWVGIGGGFDGPNPYNFMEFVRRCPDGACITLESLMKNVLPINTVAMALGLHPRCGIEDTIIDQKGNRMTSVQQVEQCARIARELGRDIATGKEAKAIYRIGVQYDGIDETLAHSGWRRTAAPAR